MEPMLDWTGQPLVDVGIAAICAMVEKQEPSSLTLDDLDRAASEMNQYYFSGLMTSYLSCVFMNAEYVQPSRTRARGLPGTLCLPLGKRNFPVPI